MQPQQQTPTAPSPALQNLDEKITAIYMQIAPLEAMRARIQNQLTALYAQRDDIEQARQLVAEAEAATVLRLETEAHQLRADQRDAELAVYGMADRGGMGEGQNAPILPISRHPEQETVRQPDVQQSKPRRGRKPGTAVKARRKPAEASAAPTSGKRRGRPPKSRQGQGNGVDAEAHVSATASDAIDAFGEM